MKVSLTYSEWQEDIFFNWKDNTRFKIVPKGRRVGGTKGSANACIDYMLQKQTSILWGDTVLGNIDRYFERYFYPELKANKIEHSYSKQEKKLIINDSFIDFRSADRPENWEGFGYNYIILNEAGIILKNPYLYTNSVLPMLMDYKDSKLIAIGTPKGKYLRNGDVHPFYALYKSGMENKDGYECKTITSYESPFMTKEQIQALENEIKAMNESMVLQEIYGQFIEQSEDNPFFYNYKDNFVQSVDISPFNQTIFCFDFNINPFVCLVIQSDFNTYCNVIDEIVIENGSIEKMVDTIRAKYLKYLNTALVTGDSMGKARNISVKNNYSNYEMIMRGLGLRSMQLRIVANPTHDNSRADCNYFLAHFPNFRISDKCPNFIRDLKYIQADNNGKILKDNRSIANQQADLGDAFRYFVNTFIKSWIEKHRKFSTFTKS